MDKEPEIVELLKQISSKLDVLNDKKEDRDFQLDMLTIQVKQGNIVLLLTIYISIAMSFLVGYFTVSLTGVIPKAILDLLLGVIALQFAIMVGSFFIIWAILVRLQMGQIDKLRPKNNKK